MGVFQRATMPENFYDVTSDMLLVQPEPQYPFAEMFLAALGASLSDDPGPLGLPGRQLPSAGAPYSASDRGALMLSNPIARELIAGKVDFNATPGQTVRVNRPVFANTTYTESSRRIASGTSISQTPINVASQQTNLTLYCYGGPYDSANSRVAPYGIQSFDANLGVHNAAQIHGSQLNRDFRRFIELVNVSLLDLESSVTYPDGMSAANDATTAGMFPMRLEQLTRAHRDSNNANLPTFSDGFRMAALTPTQIQQLEVDPAYQRAGQFLPEYNILYGAAYKKSVAGFHVFEVNTLTTANNSSSIAVHQGHVIAPGALLAGMGRRPRVMPNTNDNFGETILVMWLADLAFGLANNTFSIGLRSAA
jgi:hypothetical protein